MQLWKFVNETQFKDLVIGIECWEYWKGGNYVNEMNAVISGH